MNKESIKLMMKNFKTNFLKFIHRYQIIRLIIAVSLTIALFACVYLTFLAKTSNVDELQSNLSQTTVVYDKDNDKAGSLYAQKGTYVSFNKISSNLPKAIISTEDRNFYREHGFSIKGYGRAAFLVLKNKITGQHGISSGGSTLSQQLAKNAYLSQEQTISRKLKELFIAIQIENTYSKKQILTMYMNNAYFGNGVYGVQDASKKYFGKSAKRLTIDEAAVIAGMLSSPSNNPIDNPKAAKNRRNIVLQAMADNKQISQRQSNFYKQKSLNVKDTFEYKDGYHYPYYFDAVIDEAIDKYGLTETEIMNHGYKIYTNLDQNQQSSFQNNFKNSSLFPQNASDGTKVQAASIAMNPKNGGVSAVVGGRGNTVFRGYNRATQIKRQPGSTMKPLAVYAPALENGYYFDSMLSNTRKTYGTNNYTPKNYNNVYSNHVPMYQALAQSMNVPAVWLLNKIGIEKGYQSVKKFGIPVTSKDKNLSLALGGLSGGASPQQIAAAYGAFANNGYYSKPFYIRKIVDSSGKTIVDTDNKQNKKQIMSANVAKQMTSMMLEVFDNGTGASAKPYGYSIAGKTGSTEADSSTDADATKDKWMVGYTPDVVVATWEGFDNSKSNHHLENLSGTGLGPLFKTQMEQILPYTKNYEFNTKNSQSIIDGKNDNNTENKKSWYDQFSKKTNEFKDNFEKGASDIGKKASEYIGKFFK